MVFSLDLVRQQRNLRTGALHDFALDIEPSLRGQFFECSTKNFRTKTASKARAQLFAGDSGLQRIFFMETFNTVGDFFEQLLERRGREKDRWLCGNQADAFCAYAIANGLLNFLIGPSGARWNF